MTQEFIPIGLAPKDGRIVNLINSIHGIEMAGFWNEKTSQWEGEIFGVMGSIKVKWDKDSDIQPNYYSYLGEK